MRARRVKAQVVAKDLGENAWKPGPMDDHPGSMGDHRTVIIHDHPWGQRSWRMAYATSRDREGAVDEVCCIGAPADRSLTVAARFGPIFRLYAVTLARYGVFLIIPGPTGRLQ